MRRTTRKVQLLGAAALAAVLLALVAGCTKVTGGGQFIADGSFDQLTAGDRVTFGLTAQPTDDSGGAKGQLTFVDQTRGVTVHADLNLTDAGADSYEAEYVGDGTARVDFRGPGNKGNNVSDWSIVVYAAEGNPDYVVFLLFDSDFTPVMAWSGDVQNGNVTVHEK